MKLKGKVVLVTGGGTGIGSGICRSFAREGADIVINFNKSQKGAEDLAKEIGKQAIAIRADISKKDDVNRMIDEALNKFEKIDILVNNAAISPDPCSFLELEEKDWDNIINVNLKGVFLCSQRVSKEMIKQCIKGKIINISSVCGLLSQIGSIHYNASKSGLNSMTKTMCLELAPYGINVNGISPGAIEVERIKNDLHDNFEKWQTIIPVNRWGQPEDIGNLAVFLASNEAGFICGETIYADGGQTIQLQQPEYVYKINEKRLNKRG